jgi:exopolyphosphatase / guanosine-5'-triphosphate,3'-diphosphate pyrophosphatase
MSGLSLLGIPLPADDAQLRQPASATTGRRIAVIDIGSNSVRFVVYDRLARTANCMHNEKTICCIGRNVANTGLLYKEGCDMALESLARYRVLADKLGVVMREAVATAAARDALNGPEFVRAAEKAWGGPVRVLAGEDEARLAGEGVLCAIPEADGVVGDLGGGSLDMVKVRQGRTGKAVSYPFGPLRLMDLSRGDVDKARKLVDGEIGKLASFWPAGEKSFYAVGGIWRALARVDMLRENYPMHVLQYYTMPPDRALELCTLLSRQGRKSLELLSVVSKRRAETLPYGAIVLQAVLEAAKFREIVICAGGVREGLIFEKLPDVERTKDPLIDFAWAENVRQSRSPVFTPEIFQWSTPLFADETAGQRRLRQAALLFCDLGWRRHPDYRAAGTYTEVLNMPFGGADHRARAFIATSVFHRYSGYGEMPDQYEVTGLLSREEETLALRIGLASRLAFDLSPAAPGELGLYRLKTTPAKVVLEVPARRDMVADETVQRRLGALAGAMDRKGEILVG